MRHIKIYEEQGLPGAPAFNLRLKKGAKGTWGGYIAAGGGYKPAMWYGAAAAMMRSELSSLAQAGLPAQATDSMRNDILRQEYTVAAQPSVSYDERYGGLYSDYGGYIMSNYRYISRTGGELPLHRLQNYSAELSYAASHIATFTKLAGGYWRSWNSHTYGTVYDGTLIRMETVDSPALSHGVNVSADASKLFFAISTTVKVSASWSRTWSTLYRQYELYQSEMDNLTGSLALNTRFCGRAALDYGISASRNRSVTDLGGAQPPIYSLRQNAALNLSFAKSIFLRVGREHYYNDTVRGDRSVFFLDASLSWRMKRLELILECRNILGTDTYSSAVYSDITTYVYTYCLRPLTALLKIRFTL